MANHNEHQQDVEPGLVTNSKHTELADNLESVDARNIALENGSTNGSTTNEKSNLTPAAPDRGQWSSGLEFLLSCISMSVGLGNVWRFPYVAFENGGGAFLIPYLILLFLIGRPIYYLELIIGQFSGRGAIKMWKCVPALKGVGFAQLFSVSYVAIFYNYLMGISIFYFIASFAKVLPWTECRDEWLTAEPGWCADNPNATNFMNQTWAELYYRKHVLNISQGLWDVNSMSWKLAGCLFISWALVYLSIVKGVTSLGKVAYVTAIFPYVVLITLLIVSVFQPGAVDGIKFFFTPKFEKLLDPIVWYRAVEQSFFSLAVCFGQLVMYSSYNNFTNNVGRDCVIISVLDTITSLLAGCVIFAVLGAMAKENNEPIENVVKGGPGLAFIAYPAGLSKIKVVPQLWSVLFFIMLFVLGIGSSAAMIETILTCVKDQYKSLQQHKGKTALAFCLVYFLFGLPLTTDAGSFIMSLLDNYGVGTAAFLYGILEVVGVFWVYGIKNFCLDLQFMLGSPVSIIWKVTWTFVTPLVLIVIFIYGNVIIFQTHADESSEMPGWGTSIGWGLAGIALFQIPLWFVIVLWRQKGSSLKERLFLIFRATNDYGPIDDKLFNDWVQWKMDANNASKGGIFANIDPSSFEYQQNKSSLFSVVSSSDKDGSDNAGFVPDNPDSARVLSFEQSSPDDSGNPSNPNPKLLSTRSFSDNY